MGWNSSNNNQGTNVSTEFNSNLLRLISLNQLLDDCNEYSRNSYLNGYSIEYLKLWRNTLKNLNREVAVKMNPKERQSIQDMFNYAGKIGKIIETKRTQDGNEQTINSIKFKQHWALLDKIDLQLRTIADKKGMLMTTKQNYGDIIGEME